MQQFRDGKPDYRWETENYDLSIAKTAVLIADTLESEEAVARFCKLGWKEQMAEVPGIDEGHSGNSFTWATQLASLYADDNSILANAHSGMCFLMGCKGIGHESKVPA